MTPSRIARKAPSLPQDRKTPPTPAQYAHKVLGLATCPWCGNLWPAYEYNRAWAKHRPLVPEEAICLTCFKPHESYSAAQERRARQSSP